VEIARDMLRTHGGMDWVIEGSSSTSRKGIAAPRAIMKGEATEFSERDLYDYYEKKAITRRPVPKPRQSKPCRRRSKNYDQHQTKSTKIPRQTRLWRKARKRKSEKSNTVSKPPILKLPS